MEPKYIVREKDLDQNLQVILEKAKGKIIWASSRVTATAWAWPTWPKS